MSAQKYFEKYAYFSRSLKSAVHPETDLIIVIPCFNESSVVPTLTSLLHCDKQDVQTEVIIVFNSSETDEAAVHSKNVTALKEAVNWRAINKDQRINFEFIEALRLPKKIAGVGMARKTGMDEAVRRFDDLGKDGIIVGFDADSLCEKNYLIEIKNYFEEHENTPGCSIYFEHPLNGTDHDDSVYFGILNYELHLRYYLQAFRYTGHPHAFHTVGSSFAVRSQAYMKQGGMNKRKAGEDFYFIQKMIALGNYGELNSTKVIPSPRPSDRVPFGTGRAIMQWLEGEKKVFETYDLKAFEVLKLFFQLVPEFYLNKNKRTVFSQIPKPIQNFLKDKFFDDRINEIRANTRNINSFRNRFYNWFNAFLVLKFVHFYRDHHSGPVPLTVASFELAQKLKNDQISTDLRDLLNLYRELDRK